MQDALDRKGSLRALPGLQLLTTFGPLIRISSNLPVPRIALCYLCHFPKYLSFSTFSLLNMVQVELVIFTLKVLLFTKKKNYTGNRAFPGAAQLPFGVIRVFPAAEVSCN